MTCNLSLLRGVLPPQCWASCRMVWMLRSWWDQTMLGWSSHPPEVHKYTRVKKKHLQLHTIPSSLVQLNENGGERLARKGDPKQQQRYILWNCSPVNTIAPKTNCNKNYFKWFSLRIYPIIPKAQGIMAPLKHLCEIIICLVFVFLVSLCISNKSPLHKLFRNI